MTEPVIIATHRHLSKLHPIHQLMLPHLKYTFLINATARQQLIGAEGKFEGLFTPGAHFLDLVVSYYKDSWSFDSQALPKDLLKRYNTELIPILVIHAVGKVLFDLINFCAFPCLRGMAVPDKKAKQGVKLVVNDYPYAADGLELWDAMKTWNKEYVDVYYHDDNAILTDTELQNWWSEFRNVGHADMKDAPGWPNLKSKQDLTEIVTIMQWLCTCQHAAVNYSQYDYAAFMPQRPSKTRLLIPNEGTPEWNELQANPEKFFLSAVTDTPSTLTLMAVFELTSNHATNEEYIGDRSPEWTQNKKVLKREYSVFELRFCNIYCVACNSSVLDL